jgi:small-conductance mechanosensitive channel
MSERIVKLWPVGASLVAAAVAWGGAVASQRSAEARAMKLEQRLDRIEERWELLGRIDERTKAILDRVNRLERGKDL